MLFRQVSYTQNTDERVFTVTGGDTASTIANRLKSEGIISGTIFFKALIVFRDAAEKLYPGVYTLPAHTSLEKIVTLFSSSHAGERIRITIPEGKTMYEIADIFVSHGIGDRDEFLILSPSDFPQFDFLHDVPSLEGFLFPDTYFFYKDSHTELVVQKLLETFERKVWDLLNGDVRWYEELILASIVEAEVPHEEDRPIVAGIFMKRLEIGMALQADSTLNYILNGTRPSLTHEQLQMDSPYNTYLYKGFPPTPIGNPGISAIAAAQSPKDSPYFYFLSGEDGVTRFAKDFEEHKINRQRYLGR